MTAIPIDLSAFRDTSGNRVTPGMYTVLVGAVDIGQSNAGNTMITVFLDIVGDEAGAPTEFDGLTIPDRLTITEKALFRVVQFMGAIGIPTPRKRIQVVPESWVGKRLVVQLVDGEPYRGRVKSEVVGYSRAQSAPAAAPVDPTEAFGSFAAAPAAPTVPVQPTNPEALDALRAALAAAPPAPTVPVQPTNPEALDAAAALADRVQAAALPTPDAPIDMNEMDLSKL